MASVLCKLLSCYNEAGGWRRGFIRRLLKTSFRDFEQEELLVSVQARVLAERQIGVLKALGIRALYCWHFPDWLVSDLEPPALLFVRGSVDCLWQRGWGVVGSRKASVSACSWAANFARRQVSRGQMIVSGGAYGIDGAAHQGALAAAGKTVVWLGVATDRIYPTAHKPLFASVLAGGGALVSEIPPFGISWPSHHARRNRFIAGQAENVMVVSAEARSGSLGTATWANKLGRPVWVPRERFGAKERGVQELLEGGRARVWQHSKPSDYMA